MTSRIFASLLTALAIAASAAAPAQWPDYMPTITVSPLVAAPGVARTIKVEGILPQTCVPSGLTLSEHPARAIGGTLTIQFVTVQFAAPCPRVPDKTPYSFTTTYTPTEAGRREIVMSIPLDGIILGFGEIITRESDAKPRAGADFTGVWYESATNGSGFAFYHSQDQSDVLAGTFYGFDNTGRPFWHLIQAVEWTSETTFQARLVQLSSPAGSCPFLVGCNRLSSVAQVVGIVRGTLVNADRLQIELRSGPFPFILNEEVGRFDLQRLKF